MGVVELSVAINGQHLHSTFSWWTTTCLLSPHGDKNIHVCQYSFSAKTAQMLGPFTVSQSWLLCDYKMKICIVKSTCGRKGTSSGEVTKRLAKFSNKQILGSAQNEM